MLLAVGCWAQDGRLLCSKQVAGLLANADDLVTEAEKDVAEANRHLALAKEVRKQVYVSLGIPERVRELELGEGLRWKDGVIEQLVPGWQPTKQNCPECKTLEADPDVPPQPTPKLPPTFTTATNTISTVPQTVTLDWDFVAGSISDVIIEQSAQGDKPIIYLYIDKKLYKYPAHKTNQYWPDVDGRMYNLDDPKQVPVPARYR